ncbi:MAG: hypothetical protein WBP61_19475 [Nocardioides sp.]
MRRLLPLPALIVARLADLRPSPPDGPGGADLGVRSGPSGQVASTILVA